MATECPDCGNGFKGHKCGCGYTLPYNRADHKPEETAKNPNCEAYGCPMIGAISDSTRPPHRWLCRFHYGEPTDRWQHITQRVRALSQEDCETLRNLPLQQHREAA